MKDVQKTIVSWTLDLVTEWIPVWNDRQAFIFLDLGLPSALRDKIQQSIDKNRIFMMPSQEEAKTTKAWLTALAWLDSQDTHQRTPIVAIGGGAVLDAVAFLASVYRRGLPLTLVPTSLLAMIDAAVGGKTALNTSKKNQIGTFYRADHLIIDQSILESMPENLRQEGMSELIKIALVCDENLVALLQKGVTLDRFLVQRAIDLKMALVERDFYDQGDRKLLNFGHTYGHALEAYHQYTYPHGQCVAFGMVLELHNHRLQPKVIALLKQYGCLQNIPYSREKLISLIYSDKKRIRDSIDWIELVSLGKATLKSRLLSSVINQLPERIDL